MTLNSAVPKGLFPLLLSLSLFLAGAGHSAQTDAEFTVSRIDIEGNRLISAEQILGRFQTLPGGPFNPKVLENDIEWLLRYYEDHGYPFCQIRPYDFQLEATQLNLALNIEEGPLVVVDTVAVAGNEITRREVPVREMRLRLPTVYSQRKIDQAWARVNRLGFFSKVYPPEVYYNPERETGMLVLRVKEGKPNAINGLVGYEPKSSESKGRLTGLLEFSFGNILGTGRKAEARWSRRGVFSELHLKYEEPWVFNLPVSLGGSLNQRQESGYNQMALAISAEVPAGTGLSAQIAAGWERVVPDSAGSVFMPKSKSLTGEVELKYDTRDSPFNPTQGFLCSARTRFSYRRNDPTNNYTPEKRKSSLSRYQATWEYYRSLLDNQVLAFRGESTWITTTENYVPASEKLPLGGARSLRGYRERQFLGFRTGWLSLEYRLLLGEYSRVFVFLDGGRYSDRTIQKGRSTDSKIGYGVGIRAQSRLGIVGIDYGLGEGDGISEGKVHFGITGQF